MNRTAAAAALALAAWLGAAGLGFAATPTATGGAGPQAVPAAAFGSCALLPPDAAMTLLGAAVVEPGDGDRTGSCVASVDGIGAATRVAYRLVDDARLADLRRFYTVLARRCGSGSRGGPVAVVVAGGAGPCAVLGRLARAEDLDAVFAAHASASGAKLVDGLGDAAVYDPSTLVVRAGPALLEIAASRNGAFDRTLAAETARVLVRRLAELAS